MSEQYSSAASNGSVATHIIPFPSLAHSLSSLQYATSMQNVPIHPQVKGRPAESEEKLKRAIASATSQGIPAYPPQYPSNSSQVPTSDNYLMMRSARR